MYLTDVPTVRTVVRDAYVRLLPDSTWISFQRTLRCTYAANARTHCLRWSRCTRTPYIKTIRKWRKLIRYVRRVLPTYLAYYIVVGGLKMISNDVRYSAYFYFASDVTLRRRVLRAASTLKRSALTSPRIVQKYLRTNFSVARVHAIRDIRYIHFRLCAYELRARDKLHKFLGIPLSPD